MNETAHSVQELAPLSPKDRISIWRDVVALLKPRIMVMAGVAALAGALLANQSAHLTTLALIAVGVCLTVGAACALNMYLERDVDGKMDRTKSRPLPDGRLHPRIALIVGLLTGAGGVALLWFSTTVVATALAALALATYVLVYTPMKTKSVHSLFVGAIPGALPPLIGWAAMTGGLEVEGLMLFLVMYVWQVPHVLAISIYLRKEYENAGIRVAASSVGEERTVRLGLISTALLFLVSFLPILVASDTFGLVYGVSAFTLGVWLVWMGVRGLQSVEARHAWAKRFFFASLIYLFFLFSGVVVDVFAVAS